MKLTILRLQRLTAQDCLDLSKIWPESDAATLESTLDEHHRLYAAKFNDRLLAAVKVTLTGTQGELTDFRVREVTRRRGVGGYLLEETLAQNAAIRQWWMADVSGEDREGLAAFMQKQGFTAQTGGWVYQR
ncbi:aspartate 1-decarboxylase autocleavage activator PanM [Kalamiella sp. sgz302252]|uniref:aspartate 1-decarboxylase autocleavage activator PanM n=1 Tax=Pantoea sp. sgz302252 TaxID=3341827 RepID=UPI0036D2D19E